MPGRLTITSSRDDLEKVFRPLVFPDNIPRFNLAPGQTTVAIRRSAGGGWETTRLKWGFVPSHIRERMDPMPNARCETAADLHSFKDATNTRRCLIPADGFVEWDKRVKRKNGWPNWFRVEGNGPFAMAGIWEPPIDGGAGTFALLTTEPNDLVRPIHHRMPVIVTSDRFESWLAPEFDPNLYDEICQSFPAEAMTVIPVDPKIGNVGNEGPELLRFTPPPAETGDLFATIQ